MSKGQQNDEEKIDTAKISKYAESLLHKRQAVYQRLKALGVTEFEIDCYLQAFEMYDRNSDGIITEKEIATTFSCLNKNISTLQIRNVIKSADKNGDGAIDYTEFVEMLHMRRMQLHQSANSDELKSAFQYLDSDSSGNVSWKKVKDLMVLWGQMISDDDAKDMLRVVSKNVETGINFNDFLEISKCRV